MTWDAKAEAETVYGDIIGDRWVEPESTRILACLAAALQRAREPLEKALEDANQMCRSALQVAMRRGAETNWEAFHARLDDSLKRQHQAMYPERGHSECCETGGPPPEPELCECWEGICPRCDGTGFRPAPSKGSV